MNDQSIQARGQAVCNPFMHIYGTLACLALWVAGYPCVLP